MKRQAGSPSSMTGRMPILLLNQPCWTSQGRFSGLEDFQSVLKRWHLLA